MPKDNPIALLAAVSKNGIALEHVADELIEYNPEMYYEIALAAVRQNGMALEHVDYEFRENNPEQYLDRTEEQQRIMRAVSLLPEKIKTIVILRHIQDETYEDIAKTLKIPINTVKVYLHRGRKILAEKLQAIKKE